MYEIKINVNNDGTLEYSDSIVKLGTHLEIGRSKFLFSFDVNIEGTYRYVKFVHKKATYLKKINTDLTLVIPTEVLKHNGRWFISVLSSNNALTNDLKSDYLYISETKECVVLDGIVEESAQSYEMKIINGIIESNLYELDIPINTTEIGDAFMYKYPANIKVHVPNSVTVIGEEAFRESNISELTFEQDSELSDIKEYAFHTTPLLRSVSLPKTIASYGKYVFASSGVEELIFEDNILLNYFATYSFYKLAIRSLSIPHGILGFDSSGQVISYCGMLETLTLPNSFTKAVQSYHLKSNDNLTNIVLKAPWDCDINVSSCDLTKESLVNMINALKDVSSYTNSKVLAIGEINIEKLESASISFANSKGWTIS